MNRLFILYKLIFFRIFVPSIMNRIIQLYMYTPPFTISAHAINLIAEISGQDRTLCHPFGTE